MIFFKVLYNCFQFFYLLNSLFTFLMKNKNYSILYILIFIISFLFIMPTEDLITFCESDNLSNEKKDYNVFKWVFLSVITIIIIGGLFYYYNNDGNPEIFPLINFNNDIITSFNTLAHIGSITGSELMFGNQPYVQLDVTKNLIHYSNYSFNELLKMQNTLIAVILEVPSFDSDPTNTIYQLIKIEDFLNLINKFNIKSSTHF